MPQASSSQLRDAIIAALRTVHDPELPVNLYDLGLIYDIAVGDGGSVAVTMTLTTPNCPVAESMPGRVKAAVEAVEGVAEVAVSLVWEPPWTAERMSDDAKMQLEMLGIEWADAVGKGTGATSLTVGRTGKRRHEGTEARRHEDREG